jgi:two-component system, OmpR family, osmolarity sensor histidine kinase EnvZ
MLQVSLVLIGALVLVTVVALVAFRLQNLQDRRNGYRLPLPARVAAIVGSIEQTPREQLPTLLAALNSSTLLVSVDEQSPIAPDQPRVRMPLIAWVIDDYLKALGGRSFVIIAERGAALKLANLRRENDSIFANRPLTLIITLADGRYASIEPRGDLLSYLLGLRLVLGVFFALFTIGGSALWLIRRQIRPLVELAGAVEQLGDRLDAAPLREAGAVEVRHLVAALNRMQARIRTLVAARTHLMAAISHDLGTYLTRLRLRAEFIDDPNQRERAARDIEDMHALLQDTLTLARLDHADRNGAEPLDLRALAQRQVDLRAEQGAPARLRAGVAVMICGHRAPLTRLLSNLIDNALKYGAEVDVQINAGAERVEILVEDRGPGIPNEFRTLVLEPFARLDAARNLDQPGSGLGLAIVAEIVRLHRGDIRFEDREGGGLRVRVSLPLK